LYEADVGEGEMAAFAKAETPTSGVCKIDDAAPTTKPRIVGVQVCRGLAAMAVVFAHIHNLVLRYFHVRFLETSQFGVAGVDLFFAISGFIILSVTVGKFGKLEEALTFIHHRLARIYPVFWFYFTITFIAYLWNPGLINAENGHRAHAIQSFFLIPNEYANLVLQAWTLSFEVGFYIAFFLLMLFFQKRFVAPVLVLWAVVIVLATLHGTQSSIIPLRVFTSPLILEFLAGCALFVVYRRNLMPPYAGRVFFLLSLLWMGGIQWFTWYAHDFNADWLIDSRAWVRTVWYGPFAVLFLAGVLEMERSLGMKFPRILEAIGDWSFSI
jgi:peptidoglycan/LPS O-acetylase OafA/YrhL